ncbi:MAG TPA: hypothetical protein RMG48_05430 [Myxococcales bacterium LLY-WYZ-16_1]|jgi:hypothetical protein|nr:hypothetical protein [Myxococcales bacterium LLY-WYZ-16_1]
MAQPLPALIEALRETADRLAKGAAYRWTHMGSCNCGHLAQTVTRLDRVELHRRALERSGDWTEQVREYCPSSGLPFDGVIGALLDLGLSTGDLADLEKLRNPKVRARIGRARGEPSKISHRVREDVVAYLRAWADLLEEQAAGGLPRVPSFDALWHRDRAASGA